MKLEFHEAANIFPLDDEHLDALAADIKKNGQQIAIEIMDGKILDGRRRTMACRIAGVDPVTREVKPVDPVAYVLSLNLHRRHLTPSQASMCAARAREIYERDAKERQGKRNDLVENLPPSDAGKARDLAGKAFGVSGKSVDHAKRVIEKGIRGRRFFVPVNFPEQNHQANEVASLRASDGHLRLADGISSRKPSALRARVRRRCARLGIVRFTSGKHTNERGTAKQHLAKRFRQIYRKRTGVTLATLQAKHSASAASQSITPSRPTERASVAMRLRGVYAAKRV